MQEPTLPRNVLRRAVGFTVKQGSQKGFLEGRGVSRRALTRLPALVSVESRGGVIGSDKGGGGWTLRGGGLAQGPGGV